MLSVTAFDRMLFAEDMYFPSGTITGVWPKGCMLAIVGTSPRGTNERDSTADAAWPMASPSKAAGYALQLMSRSPLGDVPTMARIQLSARLTDGSISTAVAPRTGSVD